VRVLFFLLSCFLYSIHGGVLVFRVYVNRVFGNKIYGCMCWLLSSSVFYASHYLFFFMVFFFMSLQLCLISFSFFFRVSLCWCICWCTRDSFCFFSYLFPLTSSPIPTSSLYRFLCSACGFNEGPKVSGRRACSFVSFGLSLYCLLSSFTFLVSRCFKLFVWRYIRACKDGSVCVCEWKFGFWRFVFGQLEAVWI
jgi:hypothetical protein